MIRVQNIIAICIASLLTGLLYGCPAGPNNSSEVVEDSSAGQALATNKTTPKITKLSEQIITSPDNASLYFQRGILLSDFSNQAALEDFSRAWLLDSTDARHNIALSRQYFEMGDSKASLGVLRQFIAQQPQDNNVLKELADQALITRQHKEAISALNAILRTDVQQAEIYFLKGKNFRMMEQFEKAESSYQTAIETDPEFLSAHLELGVMLTSEGKERGVPYLQNSLNIDDSCTAAMLQLGKFYQDQDNLDESVYYYNQLINLEPQNSSALYNLATVWFGVDSLEKAYRLFDITTKVEPSKSTAYYGKGLCSMKLGENEKAIVHFQEAINLNSELEGARILLDSLSELR